MKKACSKKHDSLKVRKVVISSHHSPPWAHYLVLLLLLGEIILYDNQVVLYRSNIDIYFYVVGSAEENELILLSMFNTFYDAVSNLLR